MLNTLLKIAFPFGLAGFGLAKKLLTLDGAIAALIVGVGTCLAGWDVMGMLTAFFLAGSVATKYKAAAKNAMMDELNVSDTSASHGRTAMQVIATGGIPSLLCWAGVLSGGATTWWWHAHLAYLATCCGDTLASELGMLAKQPPILITTWKYAKPGQDGGVSLAGTAAAAAGGALIGAFSGSLLYIVQGAIFGVVGSTIDSLMGALMQPPGMPSAQWKRLNSIVNALSSAVMAFVGVHAASEPAIMALLVCVAVAAFAIPVIVTTVKGPPKRAGKVF